MTAWMKRFLYGILGLLAAAVTWGFEELALGLTGGYLALTLIQGAILGAVFGFAFGAAEGIAISERRKAVVTGAFGAGIGAIAGALATLLTAWASVGAANALGADYPTVTGRVIPAARVIGWALVGTAAGTIEGIRSFSVRRSVAGALGGFFGGALGGILLEWAVRLLPDPSIGRALGFAALGLGIGALLGEAESRFSFARLKILTGTLKNKEYILSRRKTTIGSGFSAQVYLAAYGGTKERHAALHCDRGEMRLEPVQGKATVNEKPVDGARFLKYGDVIDLGGARMLLLPA